MCCFKLIMVGWISCFFYIVMFMGVAEMVHNSVFG